MSITQEMHKALAKEFPPSKVQQKPGPGGLKLDYISHALVTERLNEVDPNWTWESVNEHIYYDEAKRPHCAGVTITMTVGGVARVEAGGPQRQSNLADELKNAYSDALKRGAMRFGVALSMWENLIDAVNDEDVYPDASPRESVTSVTPSHAPTRIASSGYTNGAAVGPTPRQGKMIFAIRSKLGMSEEELHQLAGVASLNDLSIEGVSALITKLQALQAGEETQPTQADLMRGDDETTDWGTYYAYARSVGINNRADYETAMKQALPESPAQALASLKAKMEKK